MALIAGAQGAKTCMVFSNIDGFYETHGGLVGAFDSLGKSAPRESVGHHVRASASFDPHARRFAWLGD